MLSLFPRPELSLLPDTASHSLSEMERERRRERKREEEEREREWGSGHCKLQMKVPWIS